MPFDWAMTQNNLGNALARLGERESGTGKLEEAITAYREALKERTSERVPLEWARSLGNQGVALMLLATRRKDAAMAETALSQINKRSKRCAVAAMPHTRRFMNSSFPRHAPSSRGCAGNDIRISFVPLL
jgi:tetratricopeptide (TPR) repeat protein